MPYYDIGDLPLKVRKYLPKKAQELYRKSYNKVWDLFEDPKNLPETLSRVEAAAILAWSAVKKRYKKGKKMWRRKKESSDLQRR